MTEDVTYLPPTSELRDWADHPASSGYVPVHPVTLRALAEEIDRLRKAVPTGEATVSGSRT